MTVPVGMMKRTSPSEAATAQPFEPSVVATKSGESVLLYSSMNSSLASGLVSGSSGALFRTYAARGAFRLPAATVAVAFELPHGAEGLGLEGEASGASGPGPRRRNSEMMS